jgi:hypothetical protein
MASPPGQPEAAPAKSPEITLILKLIREIYRKAGITFGV